jgi:hypothetical protein
MKENIHVVWEAGKKAARVAKGQEHQRNYWWDSSVKHRQRPKISRQTTDKQQTSNKQETTRRNVMATWQYSATFGFEYA